MKNLNNTTPPPPTGSTNVQWQADAAGNVSGYVTIGTIINFADNETVSGSGTAWTLAHTPNPTGCLQLYQYLAGFGQILLRAGTDYTLSGAAVTTTNSLTAGALRAWYRY